MAAIRIRTADSVSSDTPHMCARARAAGVQRLAPEPEYLVRERPQQHHRGHGDQAELGNGLAQLDDVAQARHALEALDRIEAFALEAQRLPG